VAPDGGGLLIVDDAGPGFPPAAQLGRGRSGAGSTGLGLDIVRRIAVDSGGSMSMDRSPSGGARVELRLGAPFREAG
jgi:signal transduction histidine kinase